MKKWIVIFCIAASIVLAGYIKVIFSPEIPFTWDMKKLETLELPFADNNIRLRFPSEDYYSKLPEAVIYKSYPVYLAGKEPPGYYEWLKQQEPEIVFDASKLKTEYPLCKKFDGYKQAHKEKWWLSYL